MNKAIRTILAILDTCLLVYLAGFNVYMAYHASGIAAAIITLVFTPISFFVWFIIVAVKSGVANAYCLAWIVSLVLALIVTKKK
jgi:hypothetical protein